MKVAELNEDEITTLISRFQSSIYKLELSGDYPERKSDQELLRKLIDLKYSQRKVIQIPPCTKIRII